MIFLNKFKMIKNLLTKSEITELKHKYPNEKLLKRDFISKELYKKIGDMISEENTELHKYADNNKKFKQDISKLENEIKSLKLIIDNLNIENENLKRLNEEFKSKHQNDDLRIPIDGNELFKFCVN